MKSQFGGDYRQLKKAVREFTEEVQLLDVQVQFVFDGPDKPFKEKTMEERNERILDNFSNMYDAAERNFTNIRDDELPLPPMFFDAILQAVDLLGVKYYVAPGEADVLIGQLAKATENSFVLSNDSDFFLMRSIQFVLLDDLDISSGNAVVYTSDIVAELLGIDAMDTTKFAICAGTDFTTGQFKSIEAVLTSGNFEVPVESEAATYARGVLDNTLPDVVASAADSLPIYSGDWNYKKLPGLDQHIEELFESNKKGCELAAFFFPQSNMDADEIMSRALEVTIELIGDIETSLSWKSYTQTFLYQSICKFLLRKWESKALVEALHVPRLERRNHAVVSNNSSVQSDTPFHHSLPVLQYREEILTAVKQRNIISIMGETGCGKSTMIPQFLLDDNMDNNIVVVVPRRMGARSLFNTAQKICTSPDTVGLRMGGGIREEANHVRLRYVTTGYMSRWLCNGWGNLKVTHIIMDEVHERSVDIDLCCLFIKKLLETMDIKVLLMSATLELDAFKTYFALTDEPIFVGARRFENEEFFVEEIPLKYRSTSVKRLSKAMTGGATSTIASLQVNSCIELLNMVQNETNAVLVFLPGISLIEELMETLPTDTFKCIPWHSSIAVEDLECAWDKCLGRLKVILATNSAESSVTLPDVDIVVCFGTCKSVSFNPLSRTSFLEQNWISKASAKQRSGRAGRVRPGKVFRLYSKQVFNSFQVFGTPEILTAPLDETILNMKQMSKGAEVTPILADMISAPVERNVELSFEYLANSKLLDSNDDSNSKLTALGCYVQRMPVDIPTSIFLLYASWLDCLPEAMAIAVISSSSRSPMRHVSIAHCEGPEEYNLLITQKLETLKDLDGGLNSEPLALSRLLSWYLHIKPSNRQRKFMRDKCISGVQLKSMGHEYQSLCKRLKGSTKQRLVLPKPDELFQDPARLNRLFFLLVKCFPRNIAELRGKASVGNQIPGTLADPHHSYTIVEITSSDKPLSPSDLENLFPPRAQWNFIRDVTEVLYFKSTSDLTLNDIARQLLKNCALGVVHPEIDALDLSLANRKAADKMDIVLGASHEDCTLVMNHQNGNAFGKCFPCIELDSDEKTTTASVSFREFKMWLIHAAVNWFELSRFNLSNGEVLYKLLGHNFAPTIQMLQTVVADEIQEWPLKVKLKSNEYSAMAFQNEEDCKLPYSVEVLKAHTRPRQKGAVVLANREFRLKDKVSCTWVLQSSSNHVVMLEDQTLEGNAVPVDTKVAVVALVLLNLDKFFSKSRGSFVSWLPCADGWVESALDCSNDPKNEFFQCFSNRLDSSFNMDANDELIASLHKHLPQFQTSISGLSNEWQTISAVPVGYDSKKNQTKTLKSDAIRQEEANETNTVDAIPLKAMFSAIAGEICGWLNTNTKSRSLELSMVKDKRKVIAKACVTRRATRLILKSHAPELIWFVEENPQFLRMSACGKFIHAVSHDVRVAVRDKEIFKAANDELSSWVVHKCNGVASQDDMESFRKANRHVGLLFHMRDKFTRRFGKILSKYTDLMYDEPSQLYRLRTDALYQRVHPTYPREVIGEFDTCKGSRSESNRLEEALEEMLPIPESSKSKDGFLPKQSDAQVSPSYFAKALLDWIVKWHRGSMLASDLAEFYVAYPKARKFISKKLKTFMEIHSEYLRFQPQIEFQAARITAPDSYKRNEYHDEEEATVSTKSTPVFDDSAIRGVLSLECDQLELFIAKLLSDWILKTHNGFMPCSSMATFHAEYPIAKKLMSTNEKQFAEKYSKYFQYIPADEVHDDGIAVLVDMDQETI